MIAGVLLAVTFLSVVYWTVAWWCVRSFFARRRAATLQHPPSVSILKPLRGADAGAYENFASFCRQDYPRYELLFGVASRSDPVVAVVKRLQEDFPDRAIRLLHVRRLAPNPKSAILQQLSVQANGDVLVVSDGDIRVRPDYLRRVVQRLAIPSVGAVTCPYRTEAFGSLPSRLEALYLNTSFFPSVVLAVRLLGIRVGLGATIAMRRADLLRLGGYGSIADYLADDYQIVNRIAGLGLRAELSGCVVTNVLGPIGYRDQWNREVRWARGIHACSGWKYLGVGLTFTAPWALAFALADGLALGALGVLAGVLAVRWLLAWKVLGYLGGRRRLRDLIWLPVRECLNAAVWSAGLFGRQVTWRGRRFWLLRGGRLESK